MTLFKSLMKGNSLRDPTLWKGAMNVVNLCSGCIPLIVVIVPEAQVLIDKEILVKLYSSLAAFNIYFTTATSDKIGL